MPTTEFNEILAKIQKINPINYGRTRNNLKGAVTQLSPYVSRGVISTKQIMEVVLSKGYKLSQCERLLQQLAWRDYFQRVGETSPNLYEVDVKKPQEHALDDMIPQVVLDANTGISAVDDCINGLYQYGYMHNHVRMYVASIVCNVGRSAWKNPGKWMYYHLLDADFASNFLSWQWICGSFSTKLYFANQENINRYCETDDYGTFLDKEYREFNALVVPDVLQEKTHIELKTTLPESVAPKLDENLPTVIYNYYNLDPIWRSTENVNRVLLLEPSHFEKFPISEMNLNFCLDLAKNIENIQIYVGEFSDLEKLQPSANFISKKHPLFSHYKGEKDERDWMFPEVVTTQPSFFKYWEKIMKTPTFKKIKIK